MHRTLSPNQRRWGDRDVDVLGNARRQRAGTRQIPRCLPADPHAASSEVQKPQRWAPTGIFIMQKGQACSVGAAGATSCLR
jgi:hypothetical protein